MSFVEIKEGSLILRVRVIPRASCTQIQGEQGDELKIRLHAPPVDGKANQLLVKFLSKKLRVPKGAIVLLSGESSRSKRLEIRGLELGDFLVRLGVDASGPNDL